MKKSLISLVVLMGFVFLSFCSYTWAQEETPTASADVGIFNKYVWRGYELSDNSVVIQPSITVGYKGFAMNLWGNLDTDLDTEDEDADGSQFNETDLTLSYDKSFGMMSVGVGYIYYGLDGLDDSQELYLCLGVDTLLSPTITIYREVAHLPGWYVNFSISHSVELPKDITLDLSASAGYYSYDNEEDGCEYDSDLLPTDDKYSSLHDGLITVGLTIPVDKHVTICPVLAYSFPLCGEADDHISGFNGYSDESDYIFGGVSVSFAF